MCPSFWKKERVPNHLEEKEVPWNLEHDIDMTSCDPIYSTHVIPCSSLFWGSTGSTMTLPCDPPSNVDPQPDQSGCELTERLGGSGVRPMVHFLDHGFLGQFTPWKYGIEDFHGPCSSMFAK